LTSSSTGRQVHGCLDEAVPHGERPLTARHHTSTSTSGAVELLEHLAEVPNTIVFVRDVGLVQAGSLVPVLIRALRASRLRSIFETELGRTNELSRSDETLAEHLHVLVVAQPPPKRVVDSGPRRASAGGGAGRAHRRLGLRHGAAPVGAISPRAATAPHGRRAGARNGEGGRGRRA
jgi:hypothetical protein